MEFVGPVLIIAGAALFVLAMRWMARVNPADRIPFFGWPPQRPGGVLGLSVLGGGVMGAGVGLSATTIGWLTWVVPLVALIPYFVVRVTHNRRVAAQTDSARGDIST